MSAAAAATTANNVSALCPTSDIFAVAHTPSLVREVS